jgi:DNA repair photolyase
MRVANRFERFHIVADAEQLGSDERADRQRRNMRTEFLPDRSQSVISENDSPDVPFRYSLNPYRGCEHGCAYCYARPSHELLGLDAGLDFETKIIVKYDAARCLRQELNKPGWRGDVITLSGVTDCYQPAERKLRITRQCLDVMLEARQAVSIVTKNALVLRDLDILAPLAAAQLAHVNLSVTTQDAALARAMEPRTSTPRARLKAIEKLSRAGVPVRVLVAPVIPGLNDWEIPSILKAAGDAGASAAGYVLLRLPLSVRPVFEDWLARRLPLQRERIESLIRSTRDGHMNDARFGSRMRGTGSYAQHIKQTFKVFARQCGLDGPLPELNTSQFQPPTPASGQLRLF